MREKTIEIGNISYSYLSEKCVSKKRLDFQFGDKYEFIYIISGSGKCHIEGVGYDFKDSTLIVLPPLTYYYFEFEDGSPYERYLIRFTGDDVSADARDYLELFDVPHCDSAYYVAYGVENAEMIKLINRFKENVDLPEPEKTRYFRFLLSQIILYTSPYQKERFYRNESELPARVIRYLSAYATRNLSLEQLSKYFFVSKYHLCRTFKEYNGISIHGYINRKRALYAKKLIESGETAQDAAYHVGYNDYSAFYRAYIKVVGRTPKSKGGDGEDVL